MGLQNELLELEKKILEQREQEKQKAIVLHAKAHMFHNKKIHSSALELMKKYNISHQKFDDLDR